MLLEVPLEDLHVIGQKGPEVLEFAHLPGEPFLLRRRGLRRHRLGIGDEPTLPLLGVGDQRRGLLLGLPEDGGGLGLGLAQGHLGFGPRTDESGVGFPARLTRQPIGLLSGLCDGGIGRALSQHERASEGLLGLVAGPVVDQAATGAGLGGLHSDLQLGHPALHRRGGVGQPVDVGVDLVLVVATEPLVELDVFEQGGELVHAGDARPRCLPDRGASGTVPAPAGWPARAPSRGPGGCRRRTPRRRPE